MSGSPGVATCLLPAAILLDRQCSHLVAGVEPEARNMIIGTSITRRVVLGSAIASAVAPRLAFGQKQTDLRGVKLQFAFGQHVFTASLEDNPSARDLVSLLPLSLSVEDYSTNEKIVYLPRKLTEEGSGPFQNEAPGDLCYYAPWGNLALCYAGYRYSSGLIRLGRLENWREPLSTRGKFPVRITRLPSNS
jgi:hypothetical protein